MDSSLIPSDPREFPPASSETHARTKVTVWYFEIGQIAKSKSTRPLLLAKHRTRVTSIASSNPNGTDNLKKNNYLI